MLWISGAKQVRLTKVSVRDGDGWVDCQCGEKHWGLFGAAGLALVIRDEILLQHRAPWVHNGDTWGLPGGARDSHETVIECALREAKEEIGINGNHILPQEIFQVSHGNWNYTTVIATLVPDINWELEFLANKALHNEETMNLQWIKLNDVQELNLHPSFAKSWPELLREIKKVLI